MKENRMLSEIEPLVASFAGASVLRMSPISGRTFLLRLAVGEEVVELTANVVEVLSRTRGQRAIGLARKRNYAAKGKGHIFEERSHWPVPVLEKLGLPLYWNEDWLKDKLELLESYVGIERVYGYPNTSVSAFAKRHFGLEVKPRKSDRRIEILRLHQQHPEWTCEEVAGKVGVSKTTAWRYIRGAEDANRKEANGGQIRGTNRGIKREKSG